KEPSTLLSPTLVSLSLCNAGVGASGHQEDFRFCGDRNQTENSSVIYEHSSANISIENMAQALVIRSPFMANRTNPSYQYSLPTTLGRYRFCVYWFKANRTLWLAYGKKSFFLGREPADGITRGMEKTKASIFNVSYVFKGQKNTSLESASEYLLPGKGNSGSKQHAIICPSSTPMGLSLQESREVQGFAVDLPRSLFVMAKKKEEEMVEHRVLLVDINSQTMFQDENSSHVLGDKVVGISLVDTVVANLSEPVVLTFFHNRLPRNVTPLCVFWREDGTGDYGCTTVEGDTRTDCRCNHLTYFAVLMVSSPEISYLHRDSLSLITYIGCLISALASISTIFFLYFRYVLGTQSKQRDQITSMHIHMNLLGAIFLLDFTFLVSEHLASSSSQAACRAGGLFLHFSLLSCLTWMGIEGYNLYRLVIEVFNAYHDHFLLKLCLVGWGLPFLCVMLIFLTNWTNYGPFYIPVYESIGGSPMIHNVVNLGFFSVVFLFNLVMLGAMVREILRQNKKGHKLKHVLALFGLSILLGIPWALVFFSFTSGVFRLVSLYIFTIVNSLQGFLIFLWYWTMVLQAKKSSDFQCSSDSVKLQPNSSQSHPG
uniref:Adhesion G-protein coupled receptor G1 n=1 Tax=Coturnix japonica TaxID=93934 RepID=A0A8C2YBN5_COTJA